MDPSADNQKASNDGAYLHKIYNLPDGKDISLGKSSFMAPEPLFFPNLIKANDESLGLH